MQPMTSHEIECLIVLLAEGNVNRAAARMGGSQPAMSLMLSRLRERFSDALLVKVGKGMALTERAQVLLPEARQLREAMHSFGQSPGAFDPAAATGSLTIAASDYSQRVLMPRFIAELDRSAPQVKLRILPLEWEKLLDQLEWGDVDLPVVPREDAADGLRSKVLFEERFVCIGRRGHPSFAPALSIADYAELPHIHLLPGLRSLATVPSRLADAFAADVVAAPLPFEMPSFQMAAVWHARYDRNPLLIWARGALGCFS